MPSFDSVMEKQLKDLDEETRQRVLNSVEAYLSPEAIEKAAQAAKAKVMQEKREQLRIAYVREMSEIAHSGMSNSWDRTKAVRSLQARYRSLGLDIENIGFG